MNGKTTLLFWLCLCCGTPLTIIRGEDIVLDFEDIPLAPDSVLVGDATQSPLVVQDVTFNRTYAVEFDCCPGDWGASNLTDLTTVGFTNALSNCSGATRGKCRPEFIQRSA